MENTTPTIVPPSTIKFTEEETKEITGILDGFDHAIVAFGKLYLQKVQMEKQENDLKHEYQLLQEQEKSFLDKIVVKYGEGAYDPSTGVFTPVKK